MSNKIIAFILFFSILFYKNQISSTSMTTTLFPATTVIPFATSYSDPCNPAILNFTFLDITQTSGCYGYYTDVFNYVSFGEGNILPNFCEFKGCTMPWTFLLWSPDGKYRKTNHSNIKKLFFKRNTFCNKSIYKNN
jgi:hypothetical protein